MGYKYDADDMLEASVDLALSSGLSKLSFGRLAKHLDVADRSIVYYFPTKADLIARTVGAVGLRLQAHLDEALGAGVLAPDEAGRRMWNVLARPDADPIIAIFFEIVGLAATSIEPYDTLAPAVVESWVDWLTPRLQTGNVSDSRSIAYATLAKLDGLLLIRHISGTNAAQSAAAHLGLSAAHEQHGAEPESTFQRATADNAI